MQDSKDTETNEALRLPVLQRFSRNCEAHFAGSVRGSGSYRVAEPAVLSTIWK
jgi:hypothetical protein